MAKVGYIYNTPHADGLADDREWMLQYGCVQVAEDAAENERLRPVWKQLLANLDRGDEIVVTKLSNAVRGSRELAAFFELCRIKMVRIISIHDQLDSADKVFPALTTERMFQMIGSLPEEAMALRRASAHVQSLQRILRRKGTEIDKSMSDWQDFSEFWMLKDSITTVVEANGASVWDIRQSAGALKVELCQHLDDEQMSELCCHFPLPADYEGESTHGSVFTLYTNH